MTKGEVDTAKLELALCRIPEDYQVWAQKYGGELLDDSWDYADYLENNDY